MTHHETTHCPDEILAAIPWYPEEIDENLRGEVESHASQCPACRDELSFIRDDKGIEINVEKRDRVYAKLLERIEEHEGVEREREPRVTPDSRRGDTRLAWPVALAASLALALVSGGLGVAGSQWLQTAPDAAPYQVAGDSTTIVAAGPALDVVFRAEAKAESIHSALRAIGGQIVSGPTQLGLYRVQLAAEADLTAAARMLRGEELGVATFAEPAIQ
jgi:anti-sigma factor RsiW